jgi:hypothetical protein
VRLAPHGANPPGGWRADRTAITARLAEGHATAAEVAGRWKNQDDPERRRLAAIRAP